MVSTSTLGSSPSVRALAGNEGTDSLVALERLSFADGELAIDMGASQAGGRTALLLGAALGVPSLADGEMVGAILSYFDEGATLGQAAQLLVDAGLMATLAGSPSNLALARLLYTNVIGGTPSTAVASALASFMDLGFYTQAEFIAAVAELPLNQSHVNLTGLAATGLAYTPLV